MRAQLPEGVRECIDVNGGHLPDEIEKNIILK